MNTCSVNITIELYLCRILENTHCNDQYSIWAWVVSIRAYPNLALFNWCVVVIYLWLNESKDQIGNNINNESLLELRPVSEAMFGPCSTFSHSWLLGSYLLYRYMKYHTQINMLARGKPTKGTIIIPKLNKHSRNDDSHPMNIWYINRGCDWKFVFISIINTRLAYWPTLEHMT